MLQTILTSPGSSSLSKSSSPPIDRRLRASVFPWSFVDRYSTAYSYWLRVRVHRVSLLAAIVGVPLAGLNIATSGL